MSLDIGSITMKASLGAVRTVNRKSKNTSETFSRSLLLG